MTPAAKANMPSSRESDTSLRDMIENSGSPINAPQGDWFSGTIELPARCHIIQRKEDGPIAPGSAVTTNGQANVAWIARPAVVGRTLIAHSSVVLAVIAPPLVLAVIERADTLAWALAPSAAATIIGIIVHRFTQANDDLRHIEAVVTLVALFFIVSVLPVPAFVALGMPLTDALFESVSGITSTGLTVAQDPMAWPLAGHFLRAWLQWTGGFAIAVAGVALILGPGPTAHQMGEVGINGRDLLSSTRAQARQLLAIYCGLTVIAIAVLISLLPSWWEGVVIGLTAISTGGFTPRPDSLASYSTPAQIVIMLICVSSTVSLGFYLLLRLKGPGVALARSNAGAILLALVIGSAIAAASKLAIDGWQPEALVASTLNFVSGFTTAGFSVAPISETDAILALILIAMVIGGGIGSTAGGIKLDRALTLARMVGLSLLRLRAPSRSVTRLIENGDAVSADRIIAIAAIVVLYVSTGLVAWLLFLAAGMAPLASLFDIVSALSTVGLSTGVTGADLPDHLKLVLVVAMLAGRLEFLALLAFILPGTWIKRS